MSSIPIKSEILIIGGGIAGIAAALELLESGKKVIVLERDDESRFGGLAKDSFGGIFLCNSQYQKRMGIKDSVQLALQDWAAFAEFDQNDQWPKRWAEQYVNLCADEVGRWLNKNGVSFFPVVHWVEKGMFEPGNSVPRFHMVWGTGYGLTVSLIDKLTHHKNAGSLVILYNHRVEVLQKEQGRIVGVSGTNTKSNQEFEAKGDAIVIASGGICGNLDLVRENWYKPWGEPPKTILNGSQPYADGLLHQAAKSVDANITHLDNMWLYAAGVHHPKPRFPGHGLSLVPAKSALWMNYQGRRIGPTPLITGFDTRFLVERICQEKVKYSWQILNRKIAIKELAVSGSEHNEAIRDKKRIKFLMTVLFGNKKLVNHLVNDCVDFVTGSSVEELAEKMNALTGEEHIEAKVLKEEIAHYDSMIDRGANYFNDDQLRRIGQFLKYRGDKVRTCKYQKIVDQKAMPLIAIREFILSRKSLGGIQTDLEGRVLDVKGQAIDGLYAIGEAAGFGGGGMHGKRSLEGTFLGGCILTGRLAAKSIAGIKL